MGLVSSRGWVGWVRAVLRRLLYRILGSMIKTGAGTGNGQEACASERLVLSWIPYLYRDELWLSGWLAI